MSMIGELRQVPATLLPALHDRGTRIAAAEAAMDAAGISVDKAWHGLSHLLEFLCSIDPLGGDPLHGPDTGYGPPRLLPPDQVQRCARELIALDEAALRDAYDPAAMTDDGVYPDVWDRDDERASNLEWLIETFRAVRDFYQDAARRGNGVLFFLT